MRPIVLLFAVLGCGHSADETDGDTDTDTDADTDADPNDRDGDGFLGNGGSDCDDDDPNAYPGATEECGDDVDQDCDGDDLECEDTDTETGVGSAAEIYGDYQFGGSISVGGDADGDGDPDVIIGQGTPNGSGWRGGYLFRGPLSGTMDLGDAWMSISGADSSLIGMQSAFFPVSGPDRLAVSGKGADAAYVFAAAEGAFTADDALATLQAPAGTGFGWSVAAADLDDDGESDLVVGQIGVLGGVQPASGVGVWLGPVDGTKATSDAGFWKAEHEWDTVGYDLATGDIDGDGVADLLIGAPHYGGGEQFCATYGLLGPVSPSGSLADADIRLVGENPDEGTGFSIAIVGDYDGDGRRDIATTAIGAASWAGSVYLASGTTRGTFDLGDAFARLDGEAQDDNAGLGLSDADVDGDGAPSLLVGAWENHDGSTIRGAVYVVDGPIDGARDLADADKKIRPPTGIYSFGMTIASPGDVDGDGTEDILVSAPFTKSETGPNGGAVLQLLGKDL